MPYDHQYMVWRIDSAFSTVSFPGFNYRLSEQKGIALTTGWGRQSWLLGLFSGASLKETIEGCGSASPQMCVSDL